MADVSKIKLPNNTVVNIKDYRIPGVDISPTSDSTNVVTSSGINSAIIENAGEVIIGTQTTATGNWTGVSKLATASDMKSGYRFTYWLPYAGSGNATLTLTFQDGMTKAINCYYSGSTRLTTHISAGNKIDFCYLENANVNGTNYTGAWIDRGYDTNNYDRVLSSYERRYLYSAENPLYRYKICGYNNGKIVPLVITNQSNTTIVDKTPTSVGIDTTSGLIYYGTTTSITSVSSAISAIYNEFLISGCQYTFNGDVPINHDVYLKGTIGTDGLFYLDTTTHTSWYVFAPNKAADGEYNSVFVEGCYYMYVGPTSTTANYLQLKYNNPVYYFNGSKLISFEDSKYLPLTGGTVTGTIRASSLAKIGGSASQFLKADGSVDSNTYVTVNQLPAIDSVPTNGSTNAVSSGGVYSELLDLAHIGDTVDTATYVDGDTVVDLADYAQKTWVENKGYLTQHQTLKTINNQSLIGSGNINISGGSGGGDSLPSVTTNDNGKILKVVSGAWDKANAGYLPLTGGNMGTDALINLLKSDSVSQENISMAISGASIQIDNDVDNYFTYLDGELPGLTVKTDVGVSAEKTASFMPNGIYYKSSQSANSVLLEFPNKNGTIAMTSDIPAAITESTVSGWGFTKNAGTLTGVKFNNVSATVSNGIASITATIPSAPGTLKTDNTTAQTASTSESLSGTINLHKVAKTGTYSDLIGTPTIPTESTVSGWGFTKNAGTITGITMNGSSKGTSGVVNLGTVVTLETDPVFTASAAHGISSTDISNWNAKQKAITVSSSEPTSSQGSNGDIWIVI